MHAPKKRVSIVWIVLGIIGALIFVDNVLGQLSEHSGVNVDGHEISQSESKQSLNEVAQLTKGVRAGDPNSLNTSYVPSTELGTRFRDLLLEAKKINSDYMSEIAEAQSPDFLSPKQLGSESGRKDARRIHKDYEAATSKYEISTVSYLGELNSFVEETTGKTLSQMQNAKAENAEIAKLESDESKSIDKMLDFVDQTKPVYDAKDNKLSFGNDGDVLKYRAIAAEIFFKQDALYVRKKEILTNRQKQINWAVNDLQSRLQS